MTPCLAAALFAVIAVTAPASRDAAGDECLHLADCLFADRFYDEAVTEYLRFLFFHDGADMQSDHAHLRLCDAYVHLGESENALRALHHAILAASTDSVRTERRVDRAVQLYRIGRMADAELELARVSAFATGCAARRRAAESLFRHYLLTQRLADARRVFPQLADGWEPRRAARVDGKLAALEEMPQKSEHVARRLSTVLPGAGQVYAGATLEGLHALVLSGWLAFATGRSIWTGDFASTLTGASFFWRYYSGNRRNAALRASEHNRKVTRRGLSEILDELPVDESLLSSAPLPVDRSKRGTDQ